MPELFYISQIDWIQRRIA